MSPSYFPSTPPALRALHITLNIRLGYLTSRAFYIYDLYSIFKIKTVYNLLATIIKKLENENIIFIVF